MAEHYGNSESYKYWKNYIFPTTDSTRQEKIHAIWLERVLSFRKNYGHQRGKLVEIGPGFGTFGSLALASGEFESVQVVEPVPELAEACRTRGLEVFEGRLEDVRDEVNMADIVVSFEVIEHIFCPRQFLQQCFRLLRTGGLVVLSCPNGAGFDISCIVFRTQADACNAVPF